MLAPLQAGWENEYSYIVLLNEQLIAEPVEYGIYPGFNWGIFLKLKKNDSF